MSRATCALCAWRERTDTLRAAETAYARHYAERHSDPPATVVRLPAPRRRRTKGGK